MSKMSRKQASFAGDIILSPRLCNSNRPVEPWCPIPAETTTH